MRTHEIGLLLASVALFACGAGCSESGYHVGENPLLVQGCEDLCAAIAVDCSGSTSECLADCKAEVDNAWTENCEGEWTGVVSCCTDADYAAVCEGRDVDVKRCFYGPCEDVWQTFEDCKGFSS